MPSQPRVCIAHPNPGPECETFIQALIDHLPGVCEVLYGGHMPCFDRNGRSLTQEPSPALPPEFSPDGIARTPRQRQNRDALSAHLERVRPDVLLAEYGPTGVALAESCASLGIPLVVKFHGYDCSVRETIAKYRAGYERIFQQAQVLVAVSAHMARALAALGAPQDKLQVIPTGVDTGRFQVGDPGAASAHFVAVGRFVNKKAPLLTLLAFLQVAAEVPEARLTMLGDGPLWEACLGLCRAMGLESRVVLPGAVGHAEVAAALGSARAFVQHSVTALNGDSEGTPNAVLEACASGLPVAGTRHAGIPEVVLHEETGLLCDEGDVEAMAAHMLRLAREPETAVRFGRNGRSRVEALYRMEDRLDALARILQEAARRPA